jgi:BspA type Leucine rich repeat region (6 copies)
MEVVESGSTPYIVAIMVARFRQLVWLAVLGFALARAELAHGQFYYQINADNTITLAGYDGYDTDLVITNMVDGMFVTSLGSFAFLHCYSLITVSIPDSVTSIGDYAFAGCAELTNISFSDSVANIGNHSFSGCSKLNSISMPTSVTNIGDGAFTACAGLTSITIPDSVTNMGNFTFEGCYGLTNVFIGNGIKSIGNQVFQDCVNLISITIPNNVTSIGEWTFFGCVELRNVAISTNITSIGKAAFIDCSSLTSMMIPNSVTNIDDLAFSSCFLLTNIFFLGNAPSLGGPDVFFPSNNPTAFYLPNTTGWDAYGSSYGGISLVCWNPMLQPSRSSPILDANGFHFDISGSTNIPIVIQACTNLKQGGWFPLQALALTNGLYSFTDPNGANYPACFYRVTSP